MGWGGFNPFNINSYTKPVKKAADDIVGIDDSGGIVGTAKNVADDFLGIDDSGGIIGPVVKIGENIEDGFREISDEVDKLIENPYVRAVVSAAYPGIAAYLNAYAKLDSGEELNAADIAALAIQAGNDFTSFEIDPEISRAVKTSAAAAESDDPIGVLVAEFGADAVEASGLGDVAKESISGTYGEDVYNFYQQNEDILRAGYEIGVEGKDASDVLVDRFGDKIVTQLGAESTNERALGWAGLKTAVALDQGLDSNRALLSGAEEYYTRGGGLPDFGEIADLTGVKDYIVGIGDLGFDLPTLQGFGLSVRDIFGQGLADVSGLGLAGLFGEGFSIPEIQGLGIDITIPELEGLGFSIPEIADLGFDISGLGFDRLFEAGFSIPEIQGLGIDITIPQLEGLGFSIPEIADLGFDISSLGLEGLEARGFTLPEIRGFGVDISGLSFPDLKARGFELADLPDLGFDIPSMNFEGLKPTDLGFDIGNLGELVDLGIDLRDLDFGDYDLGELADLNLDLQLPSLDNALSRLGQQPSQLASLEPDEDLFDGTATFEDPSIRRLSREILKS